MGTIDELVDSARRAESDGFDSFWMPQIFGFEALSVLGIIGREVPRIALGTAVVPTYPRHPLTMAAEALTTQAASGGRLTLGIGLSHQMVVENMWGLSYDRPAQHMSDYLDVLTALLTDRSVNTEGEGLSVSLGMTLPDGIDAPDVVVAALGPKMLTIAGSKTQGTVTWMTGPKTLESHIVPSLAAAAAEAGRTHQRVVAALPVCVTSDEAAARQEVATTFEMYGFLPSYRAMLDREGVEGPADVAIVGSAQQVTEAIGHLGTVGVTEFVAVEYARDRGDREATRQLLAEMNGG